jgi:Flp pilus assembly protein TadD
MLLRNNYGLSLALAGNHDEALELLSAVVDEPGATARNRQNLALAYGLAGNLVAAERISRLDLDTTRCLAFLSLRVRTLKKWSRLATRHPEPGRKKPESRLNEMETEK